jgi:DNA-binding XRE family transcriptional regulator
MSELIDHMTLNLTGRPGPSESQSLPDILTTALQMARTQKAAAGMLGVSTTTFYRWRTGKQKPKIAKRAIVAAIRRGALSPAREKRIRSKQETMRITGLITFSADARRRTVNVGQYIPRLKMGNVLSAWLAGDDARAGRLLNGHIAKHYAQGLEFDETESVRFE